MESLFHCVSLQEVLSDNLQKCLILKRQFFVYILFTVQFATLHGGILLIHSPVGHSNLAILAGWPY